MMRIENDNLDDALVAFCKSLYEGEFFRAHEQLEEAWHTLRRRKDPLTSAIKGLINAAIALEHLKRDRPKSRQLAQRAIQSYIRRSRCEEALLKEAYEAVESLRAIWRI